MDWPSVWWKCLLSLLLSTGRGGGGGNRDWFSLASLMDWDLHFLASSNVFTRTELALQYSIPFSMNFGGFAFRLIRERFIFLSVLIACFASKSYWGIRGK